MYGKLASNSRCQSLSAPKRCPSGFGVWHTVPTAQLPPPAQPGARAAWFAPFSAAQSVQRGRSALCANVTRKPVRLMNWDIKQVVIFILDGQIFPLNAVNRRAEQANKLTDTVVHVHDPISRLQVAKDQFRRFGNHWRASAHLRARPAENFTVGYQVVDFAIFALQHPTTRKRSFNKARLGCIRETAGLPSSQS